MFVRLFLFNKEVHFFCILDSTSNWYHMTFFFFLTYWVWVSWYMLPWMALCHSFLLHCKYVPHLFYPFLCQRTLGCLSLAIVNNALWTWGCMCLFELEFSQPLWFLLMIKQPWIHLHLPYWSTLQALAHPGSLPELRPLGFPTQCLSSEKPQWTR